METPTPHPKPAKDGSSSVDASRPFRSVREAVAIFDERVPVGEVYSPGIETTNSWRYFLSRSPSDKSPGELDHHEVQNDQVFGTLKKLEAELEETKAELKLLKEREYATEIALASLNAEVHMNMSKLAAAEAAAAKKAAESTRAAGFERKRKEDLLKEEERRRELTIRMGDFPTLAQILDLGGSEKGSFRGKKERKVMKKKPIVPLVGDFFFKKKVLLTVLLNTLYMHPLKCILIEKNGKKFL
ncbi:WEB family protein [Salix suchowensis]|nr:WEB family protein [Salix suchowensis]